jgi:lipopolysaccharide export system protein LptC
VPASLNAADPGRPVKALDQSADFASGRPLAAREARRTSRSGADRYSRAVAFLKRVLPAIGAALLLLVAAWPRLAPLLESARLKLPVIDLREARELTMIHPRYAGTDRLNRPYVITAAVGHQLPNRSDLMSLDSPRAVTVGHGGAKIVLTAATAIYQSQSQLLDLFDNVTLTHQNGTRFVTQRAHANLANNTAEGHVPIEGHGPSGDIWGQGFRIIDRGDTITFTGQSRAILKGTKPTKTPPPPPEPSSEVLKTAAAVEAAAMASPIPPAAPASSAQSAAPAIRPLVTPRRSTMTPRPTARRPRHHLVGRAGAATLSGAAAIGNGEPHVE